MKGGRLCPVPLIPCAATWVGRELEAQLVLPDLAAGLAGALPSAGNSASVKKGCWSRDLHVQVKEGTARSA